LNVSKKKLKKAPIPFVLRGSSHFEEKLIAAMRIAFERMFGERFDVPTRERKMWGAFLNERGIHWELILRAIPKSSYAWEGWEFSVGDRGQVLAKPSNLEGYVSARCYFIPEELADKMLVLGDLL